MAEPQTPNSDDLMGDEAPDFWEKLTMHDEEINLLNDPEYIWRESLIAGQSCVICAPSGSAKTHLAIKIAEDIVADTGKKVIYLNYDCSASDLKFYFRHSQEGGYILLSDINKRGLSADKLLDELKKELNKDQLDDRVFIFDTLKKFVNVIDKRHLKAFNQLIHRLCGLGATCIMLSHTNKYKGQDGELVFEGTGDLKSDNDSLIYLEKLDEPHGLKITARFDKSRGLVKPFSFDFYKEDRRIEIHDEFTDIANEAKSHHQYQKDLPNIEIISEAIKYQSKNTTQLIKEIVGAKLMSKGTLLKLLKIYSNENLPNHTFHVSYFLKNEKRYGLAVKINMDHLTPKES